jgi:hypothetical protein
MFSIRGVIMNELIYGENTGVGYKVFLPDWTTKNGNLSLFEVGKEYIHDSEIELCKSGFHFCENLIYCFKYYDWDICNKVALIHFDKSTYHSGNDKSVCKKLYIVRELDWNEVYKICNTGLNCTGHGNSGHRNSGHRNSGDRNSGHSNSGHRNSGDRNSGDRNSGHRNSGDRNSGHSNSGHGNSGDSNSGHGNSGHRNSGDRNSGHGNSGDSNSGHRNSGNWNSGNWNSGNWNSGLFNTETSRISIFDKQSNMSFNEVYECEWYKYLTNLSFTLNTFVFESQMSDEEKKLNPHYVTLGGYMKTLSYKESWAIALNGITEQEKELLRSIPNWNAEKFFEITGVKI